MRRHLLYFSLLLLFASSFVKTNAQQVQCLKPETLKDKIKGGWAGQTIGVTYGAPVEFHYQGSIINDYQKLNWDSGMLKRSMTEGPGIYDDLYMDLTFMEVFEKYGLDADVTFHADAFARAGYMLWHANQAARYNILNGIAPPLSGFWMNNPHADCIDFQIESDFAGLISPGMPQTASAFADKIGHIMNYGDGWYGGVFVSNMYSLAFTNNDVNFIVNEALKSIPENTGFRNCIADVILWHKKYPDDWKQTWFEIQKKWTDETGCPEGVFSQFNIDAKINAAYVVLGLLYGNGDLGKSIEIATRAGQDADCNPSTVAGILGTMMGYSNIPDYWKMGLADVENMDFKYTHTSLNKVYDLNYRLALENINNNGGTFSETEVRILTQKVKPVAWEQGFTGIKPADKQWLGKVLKNETDIEFTGSGFVITGEYKPLQGSVFDEGLNKSAEIELTIDGKNPEIINLPMSFTTRKTEIAWKYDLENSKHKIHLKWMNPDEQSECFLRNLIIYTSEK